MLPTVFISHGSPMLAVTPGEWGVAWQAMAAALLRPSAILMVSAHWATREPMLSTATTPETIHDFGGFPPALYRIHYPAPGAPVLAQRVRALLEEEGIAASFSDTRGLDHGAWVPLRQMYPDADIPVTLLSVQPARNAAWHLALGRALQRLRAENVLVIASGSLTHNLYEVAFAEQGTAASEDYVRDFQEWAHQALVTHNDAALEEWDTQAPFARRAHPTPEHFLPLLVAYGAAGRAPVVRRTVSSFSHGVLAMDCYVFGEG